MMKCVNRFTDSQLDIEHVRWQFLWDQSETIKDLLATLVSLRVFTIHGYKYPIRYMRTEEYLPYIMEVSDLAPHLGYFAILEGGYHYAKRICGKWVICGEAEFPSQFSTSDRGSEFIMYLQ